MNQCPCLPAQEGREGRNASVRREKYLERDSERVNAEPAVVADWESGVLGVGG